MDNVQDEIEAKIIEKQPEPVAEEQPAPKPKKERTQAQKDAFEKARKKRMENIQKKKEDKAKEPKKPRGSPRKSLQPTANLVKRDNYPRPVQHQPHPAVQHNIPYQGVGGILGGMPPAQYYQPQPQPPPQVHNYYYGSAAPSANAAPPIPKDLPIVSSEEDYTSSEEEYEYDAAHQQVTFDNPTDARYYEAPPQPTMKYRFG